MARIICEYCGTEYEDNMPRCPLCGTINEAPADEESEEEARPARRRTRSSGGARVARSEDRIPKWIIALICVVLGIAVVIGAVYAMYAMGVFSPDDDEEQDTTLTLPVTDDDGTGATPPETGTPNATPSEPTGEVACVSIVVSPDATIHLSDEGVTQTVTVTVLPAECTQPLTWQSSDESICTVDNNGVITAVDGGTATVTVTCGQIQREIVVSCDFQNSQENNASLNHMDISFFSVGEQTNLIVNNPPRNAEIRWESSDPAICTVDDDGLVVAAGDGTATVTADVNGRKLECIVRCNIPGHAPATSGNAETGGGNRLDHSDVSLNVGESFEISVVDGVSGGWNVTDGSVISVNGNGIVTGLAAGQAEVYTVIGGERLSCIVRVR